MKYLYVQIVTSKLLGKCHFHNVISFYLSEPTDFNAFPLPVFDLIEQFIMIISDINRSQIVYDEDEIKKLLVELDNLNVDLIESNDIVAKEMEFVDTADTVILDSIDSFKYSVIVIENIKTAIVKLILLEDSYKKVFVLINSIIKDNDAKFSEVCRFTLY